MEEALYEIPSMRRFAGFSLGSGSIPDETIILNFRHPLEANKLTEHIFALINQYLLSNGLGLSKGTILDATIIEAPSSTKNAAGRETPRCTRPKRATTGTLECDLHRLTLPKIASRSSLRRSNPESVPRSSTRSESSRSSLDLSKPDTEAWLRTVSVAYALCPCQSVHVYATINGHGIGVSRA